MPLLAFYLMSVGFATTQSTATQLHNYTTTRPYHLDGSPPSPPPLNWILYYATYT